MVECIQYTSDIKYLNTFDRNMELANGLETDNIRMFYYRIDHYYKEIFKNYEYYKLCTILKGSKNIEIKNQEKFIHNKGDFVLLPPHLTLSLESSNCIAMVFEINDILLEKIRNKACIREEFECDPLERERHPLFRGTFKCIKTEIEKITSTASGKSRDKEFLIDLYAQEMVYKLLNRMSCNIILEKKNNHSIHKAIELMKTEYRKNIDLSEIAHSVNMTPTYFSTKFKKITGFSPHIYYTNIKLNEAKKMLKYQSVTDVAYDLGYDNISHFIRLFYEKYKLTPKQYQLQFYNNVL